MKGRETIHFNADAPNTELFFRTTHSVSQLNIYGAVSNWSGQLGQSTNETEPTSERFTTTEDSVNPEILKSVNSQEVNSLLDSQGVNVRLETDCERIFRILRHNPNPVKLQEIASLHHSGTWWKLVFAARPFRTWMMVLQTSHPYAESTHYSDQIQIPEYFEHFQSIWSNSWRNSDSTGGGISESANCWYQWN